MLFNLMGTATFTLSQAQVAFFQQNGYLVLEQVIPSTEITRLSNAYDELFRKAASLRNGDFFSLCGTDIDKDTDPVLQLMNCSRYIPDILKGSFFQECAQIAQQLLGETCSFKQDFAICKPALSQGVTPWHQDNAYLGEGFDYNNINIWIPLQPVNQENGCMQFIPGDTQQPILPHYRINHDARIEGVQCDVDESQSVACPLKAGDISIHHVKTLHSTGPNRTNTPRKAYILEFQTPPQKRAIPHHFPWATDRHTQRVREYHSFSGRVRNKMYWVSQQVSRLLQSGQ